MAAAHQRSNSSPGHKRASLFNVGFGRVPSLPSASPQQRRATFVPSFSNQDGQQGDDANTKFEDFVLQAFIQLVVHILGMGVFVAFYYNFRVLDRYVMALFWACIVSIPLFQAKMRIVDVLLGVRDLWSKVRHEVVDISDDGVLQLQDPDGEAGSVLEFVLPKPANTWSRTVKVMKKEAIKQLIEEGKPVQAVVRKCHSSKGLLIVTHVVPTPHWLGILRPYSSIVDLVTRDFGRFGRAVMVCTYFLLLRPLKKLRTENSSSPFFALLFSLCFIQVCSRVISLDIVLILLLAGGILYLSLVVLRLLIHLFGFLVVMLAGNSSAAGATGSLLLKCCRGVSSFANKFTLSVLDFLVDNCHMILALLILIGSITVFVNAVTVFFTEIQRESMMLWGSLYSWLQSQPAFDTVVAQILELAQMAGLQNLSGASNAKGPEAAPGSSFDLDENLNKLWSTGQTLITSAVPEYQDLIQQGVPDFMILKYIVFDMWQTHPEGVQSGSFEAVTSFAHKSVSKEDAQMCADAAAGGASCEVTPSWQTGGPTEPLQNKLNTTTSMLRQLMKGNFSAVSEHGKDAYTELMAVSSLLGLGEKLGGETGGKIKDGAMQGGAWVASLTGSSASMVLGAISTFGDAIGQTIIFLTVLFYLLGAQSSVLEHVGELLLVIDQSKTIFRISELVVRAVLLSALKMSMFHALFTWLVFTFARCPVVMMPTLLAALVAMLPIFSPIFVSIWAGVYLWVQNQKLYAVVVFAGNIAVWWQVPFVIYAEIPESNPWLTGVTVVLGMGQFGVSGVVLGPLIASVPLICLNLLHMFNEARSEEVREEVKEEVPGQPRAKREAKDGLKAVGRSRSGTLFNLCMKKEVDESPSHRTSADSVEPEESMGASAAMASLRASVKTSDDGFSSSSDLTPRNAADDSPAGQMARLARGIERKLTNAGELPDNESELRRSPSQPTSETTFKRRTSSQRGSGQLSPQVQGDAERESLRTPTRASGNFSAEAEGLMSHTPSTVGPRGPAPTGFSMSMDDDDDDDDEADVSNSRHRSSLEMRYETISMLAEASRDSFRGNAVSAENEEGEQAALDEGF